MSGPFQQELVFASNSPGARFPIANDASGRTEGAGRHAGDIDMAPLDATFRESHSAPFHSWFPFLEGYSPRFVRRVRSAYLPDATRILEPFAGSGTTPIVLSQDGVECGYAEANPVMSLVCDVKLNVLAPDTNRKRLKKELEALALGLSARISLSAEDTDLCSSYTRAFGTSVFFGEPVFRDVLKLRSLGDELIANEGPMVGGCFTVAVMASLIECSLLKRAGDVRYRTAKELERGIPDLTTIVHSRLLRMAQDVDFALPTPIRSRQLTEDARDLQGLEPGRPFDGVITSPPYLNGTNYIRNARLELWYLRCVQKKSDLRDLRNNVVTSGINDVDSHTRTEPVSEAVERIVERLRVQAYDDRIAKMVAGYFFDMRAVLVGIRKLVKPGGTVCIDIGDSTYAGVHVPTDNLLVEVANDLGFSLIEMLYLRKRRSKGGDELRQTLIVLRRSLTSVSEP